MNEVTVNLESGKKEVFKTRCNIPQIQETYHPGAKVFGDQEIKSVTIQKATNGKD